MGIDLSQVGGFSGMNLQPGAPSQGDPTMDMLNASGVQAQPPANNAQNAGPVKAGLRQVLLGMLKGASYGAGQAMTHAAGLPTDRDIMMQNVDMAGRMAQTRLTNEEAQNQELNRQMTLRRLQMLQQMGSGSGFGLESLGQLTPDEQAQIDAARSEATMKGDAEPLFGAVQRITQNRAISSRLGGSNFVIDNNPNSPTYGQPLKQLVDKSGKVMNQLATTPQGNLTNSTNNWISRANAGDPVAKSNLDTLVGINTRLASIRGSAYASAKADNTPFVTFDDNGALTTTTVRKAIDQGLPSATVWNSIYGPTGSTKTQGQAAGAVEQHIPDAIKAINNLSQKGQLGAIAGRINEWETKGYGGNDPDIAELVTTVGLLDSGAVRAHFGARGGAQILDKFHGLLNMAQEPQAMIGSLNGIDKFLRTYKNVGIATPPSTNLGGSQSQGPRISSPPSPGASLSDPAIAQKYLTAAGGNKAAARKLAQSDGWKF